MKLGSLRKTLERLSSRTYGPLKGLTFTDRKLLHFGFALTSRPLSEPKQPVTYFSSVLLQGVNPGDSRYTGTVVFLPDPAAFRPGQWSQTRQQTIPVDFCSIESLRLSPID